MPEIRHPLWRFQSPLTNSHNDGPVSLSGEVTARRQIFSNARII